MAISAILVPHKWRYRRVGQIKVVFGIECGVSAEFEERPVEAVASRFGYRVDNAATIPAVLYIEGLRQDANLREFIQSQKGPGSSGRRIAEHP